MEPSQEDVESNVLYTDSHEPRHPHALSLFLTRFTAFEQGKNKDAET